MKSISIRVIKIHFIFIFLMILVAGHAQKTGVQSITISDLESHLYFLASDELQGRATGEPGLEIAASYLGTLAKKTGLKAVDDNKDYYQTYIIEESSWDTGKSAVSISSPSADTVKLKEDIYMILPPF